MSVVPSWRKQVCGHLNTFQHFECTGYMGMEFWGKGKYIKVGWNQKQSHFRKKKWTHFPLRLTHVKKSLSWLMVELGAGMTLMWLWTKGNREGEMEGRWTGQGVSPERSIATRHYLNFEGPKSHNGLVWIRHSLHEIATQSSHSVDRDGWISQNGFHWDTMT